MRSRPILPEDVLEATRRGRAVVNRAIDPLLRRLLAIAQELESGESDRADPEARSGQKRSQDLRLLMADGLVEAS